MPTHVLVVESSPCGAMSATRQLTQDIIETLKKKDPNLTVTVRDLFKNPPPHVTDALIGAVYTPEINHTADHKKILELSDTYLKELFAADILVLGAPMWNFNIPSSLKAWIDHIVRVGKTFAYLPEGGYKGLLSGKKIIIASASGGVYSNGPMKAYNFNEPYLRTVFGFIGISDVQSFSAEGSTNPETQKKAVAAAKEKIRTAL